MESLSFGCGAGKGPCLCLLFSVVHNCFVIAPPTPKVTLGRLSSFTIRQIGGQALLGAAGWRPGRGRPHLEPLCPSTVSWCVLECGHSVLFQMPVTFEDVALYLSREEWGRLDHAQQSFYRDVLQKRNGLSLGKGPRLCWGGHCLRPGTRGGAVPPSPPSRAKLLLIVHVGCSGL